jgi:hypothetical protein
MKRIKAAFAALILVGLVSSCELFNPPVTISDCITSVKSAMNSGSWSAVFDNLDSGAAKFAQAKTNSYWTAYFPVNDITYTLTTTTTALVVTGTLNSKTLYSSAPIVFVMSTADTLNYKIKSISLNGASIFD